MTDTPPTVGPFTLLGHLGTDTDVDVHVASDAAGRVATVTLMTADTAGDQAARARFADRVEAARRLQGPWMVPLLDAGPAAARPWSATAFVPGPTLEQAVRAHGALPVPVALALARTLAGAIAAAHRRGVVHGGLHPARIVLAPDGPWIHGPTGSGTAYTAPDHPVGPASDVYGLGAVVAFAVTGRDPGDGPDLDALPEPLRGTLSACLDAAPQARPVADALLPRLPGPDPGPGWLGPVAAPRSSGPGLGPPGPDGGAADPGSGTPPVGPPQSDPGQLGSSYSAVPYPGAAQPGGRGTGGPTSGAAQAGAAQPGAARPGDTHSAAPGVRAGAALRRQRVSRRTVIQGAAALVVVAGGGLAIAARNGAFEPSGPPLLWQETNTDGRTDVPLVAASDLVLVPSGPSGEDAAPVRGLDPRTGETRWSNTGAALLAGGDAVVVTTPVACLDPGTGRTRWETPDPESPFDERAAAVVADPVAVAYSRTIGRSGLSSTLDGLRLTDGSVAWSVPAPELDPSTDEVRGAGGAGRAHVVLNRSVITIEAYTGRVLWRQQSSIRVDDVQLCAGVLVAVDVATDVVAGIEPATGRLLWTAPLRSGPESTQDRLETSPPVNRPGTDGTQLLVGRGSALVGIDPRTGTERWTTDLVHDGRPVRVLGAPAVGQGLAFAFGVAAPDRDGAEQRALVAVDAQDGEPQWSVRVGDNSTEIGSTVGRQRASLASVGDTIVVSSDSGSLYAYGPVA